MENLSSIVQRVLAPTPVFFKKLRTVGLMLTSAGGALLAAHSALPDAILHIGGYLTAAGGVLTSVCQATVEDVAKRL